MNSDKNIDRDRAIARRLAEAVSEAGGRAYYVGGYVRDRIAGGGSTTTSDIATTTADLSGATPATGAVDIDIEVHGVAAERLEEILDRLGGCTRMGVSFGIYGINGCDIDIALPRKERATGFGHRDFQVFVDPNLGPEKAARRRDFTVNAMMEDVLTGEVLDFYGGRQDLEQGILRHVDDESFDEDPLRVLRGAQFAARFNMEMADETLEICKKMDISTLAPERVFGELEKALCKAEKPSIFFNTLRKMNQLSVWFPEVEALIGVEQPKNYHPEGDVWNHTMLVLDAASQLCDSDKCKWKIGLMMSALCHDLGKVTTTEVFPDGKIHALNHEVEGLKFADSLVGRLTNNRKLKSYVKNMTLLHMRPNILAGAESKIKSTNKMFDQSEDPEGLILLGKADVLGCGEMAMLPEREKFLWERLEIFREMMARPYVQGADLIAAGLEPGPGFSEILAYAHKMRLAGVSKENALAQTLAYWNKP